MMSFKDMMGALLVLIGGLAAGARAEPAARPELRLDRQELQFRLAGRELLRLAGPRLYAADGTSLPGSGFVPQGNSQGVYRAAFGETLTLEMQVLRPEQATLQIAVELRATRRQQLRNLTLPLLLPVSIAQSGGAWQIGSPAGQTGSFPVSYKGLRLYQGPASEVGLRDGQGREVNIHSPAPISTVIQDNRHWNWAVFECQLNLVIPQAVTPQLPHRFSLRLQVRDDVSKRHAIVDELGQYRLLDWPAKLRGETALLALGGNGRSSAAAAALEHDRFGGVIDSTRDWDGKATGFFHVHSKDGRAWLVTPQGHRFLSMGICALTTWDTFTPTAGRHELFTWLPPRDDARFGPAWIDAGGQSGFSFYVANMIRRFGDRHHARFERIAAERFRDWGFNTTSAFGDRVPEIAYTSWRLREVINSAGRGIPGTAYAGSGSAIIDIYDPAVEAKLNAAIGRMVQPMRDDPWLVGHFLGNEEWWHELGAAVCRLPADWHAKRELATHLRDHYDTIAALQRDFRVDAASWEQVAAQQPFPTTDAGRRQLHLFAAGFLDRYLHLVTQAVRKADPDHLVLGSRLLPEAADAAGIVEAFGRHCDVVSVNYYTDTFDARRVREWHERSGRPLLLSEWSYGAPGRGHSGGPRTVADQQTRAQAYGAYVQAAMATGCVVGTHWFEYLDQPVTGRMNEGDHGERYNVGLVDVTDQPYPVLVDAIRDVHRRAYEPATPNE